jgi:hypothetical protein
MRISNPLWKDHGELRYLADVTLRMYLHEEAQEELSRRRLG